MKMEVIDHNGEWWINTAAFRMVDPTRLIDPDGPDEPTNWQNFAIDPGIKYQIRSTAWMQNQPVMLKTDPTDDEAMKLVQSANETKPMADLLAAHRESTGQAPAQVEATPEAIAAAEAAVVAQSKPAKGKKADAAKADA